MKATVFSSSGRGPYSFVCMSTLSLLGFKDESTDNDDDYNDDANDEDIDTVIWWRSHRGSETVSHDWILAKYWSETVSHDWILAKYC